MLRIISKDNSIEHSPGLLPAADILIVPEQYSHDAERELAALYGDSACLTTEVLTFSRIATRVLTEVGANRLIPDKAAKILLMRRAFLSVADKLTVYAGQTGSPEFLEKLLALHDEFSISKANLSDLADLSDDAVLARKLADISLIFAAFTALSALRCGDGRDKLTQTAEHLTNSNFGKNAKITFDKFSDFTKPELDVIAALMRKDAEITVLLYLTGDDDAIELPRKTYFALRQIAERNGVPAAYPELHKLPPNEFARAIRVNPAASIADECEYAARNVLRWLKEGVKPSEIAVTAPKYGGGYDAVCRAIFKRYGIPFYRDIREDILSKPVMTLVTELYEIISGGWRYEHIFRYVKTNLSGITLEEADELENYCLTWNIKGERQWMNEWKMSPRGYVDADTPEAQRAVKRIEKIHQRLIAPIVAFRKLNRHAATAGELVNALYSHLQNINLASRLEEKSAELLSIGEEKMSAEYSRLWDILITALETLFTAIGDMPMEYTEFGKLLTVLLRQYELTVIPPALNRVRLCDLAGVREIYLKKLIVMGTAYTAFPNIDSTNSLLSDYERAELDTLGMELHNGYTRRYEREAYLAARVFNKCDTIVTYLKSDRASFLIPSGSDFSEEVIATERYAPKPVQSRREALSLSETAAKALYGEKPSLSASKTEDFNSCKYSFFIKHGLRAKQLKSAGLDAPEFGTLMHYVLERVSKEVAARGGFGDVAANDVKCLAEKFTDAYAKERLKYSLTNARFAFLFNKLRAEVADMVVFIAAELAASNFEPNEFEVNIRGEFSGIPLSGVIDRVDALALEDTLFVRVTDYKTGAREFSLSDVCYGLGIQMLVYLFAYTEFNPDNKPAGVYYTPVRDLLVSANRRPTDELIAKERKAKLKGSGLILEGLSEDKAGKLVTAEQLGKLGRYVENTLRDISAAISSGAIETDPYLRPNGRSPCDYCGYIAICGGSEKRKLVTLKGSDVWEKIDDGLRRRFSAAEFSARLNIN